MPGVVVPSVKIGQVEISRFILGGNPFSGFSHQGPQIDDEMRHWYTVDRIKSQLRLAEQLGITTHIGRADNHVGRYLMEYWDEGGKIKWIGQTCPEIGTSLRGVANAVKFGASACYIHGGRMDWLLANDQLDEAVEAVAAIKEAGLPAGIAGHSPAVFDWAEANIDVDFYMCSYYNPTDRSKDPAHDPENREWFLDEARNKMVARIRTLSKPAIHYKVFAAGRNDPKEALEFAARHLRPQDAVCVGVFSKIRPDMLAEDLRLFMAALEAVGTEGI